MRMLIRIVLFFLTLFLGLQAVTLANAFASEFLMPARIELAVDRIPTAADYVLGPAEFPRGVRITYDGVFPAQAENHPSVLRFLIYNGSFDELTCIGYRGICASPEIRVHGVDASAWVCMNGSSRYTIKPGESAELMVTVQDLNLLPTKSELVMIGYKFEHPDGRSDQYFAEPIVLPAEFRKAVSKYLKEVRDLEAGIY